MASSSLEDDLSCPVCCEVYQDPQLLPCGHSFCRRCLDRHWSGKSTRTCAVCRQVSEQRPVSNLSLRNACESFLREKEKGSDGGVNRVKDVLRPAEKALDALKGGTSRDAQIVKYIESQAEKAERLIKQEFERFHNFLHEEEQTRVTALRKEVEQKRSKVKERIEQEIRILSGRVKEVEGEMENDGATFLQNFDFVLQRAEYTEPDSEFGPESLINMPEHVGNLGHQVWLKMTNIFRYYPVVLDPNSAPADFTITDDLACVGKSNHELPIPLTHRGKGIALGSEGFIDAPHCWEIEVGYSKHWTIGVCQPSAGILPSTQPLCPEVGFWGLSRKGESYSVLGSKSNFFRVKKKLRMVRVQLGWRFLHMKCNQWMGNRVLSFLDASDDSLIAHTRVPNAVALFPFLIPGERCSLLRIAPADLNMPLEHHYPLENPEKKEIFMLVLVVIVFWIIGLIFKNE
ncbi:E3 ubiquitin-protein ligase TRIM35-like isoform X2 [Hoplias malabaricus]|uniref:E3 ubiquitin-protein ligase TRIM35-like isoform X2 n=1 Tax=Hoplias malabaricus TaxID=27720 RepID=UPI003461EF12